MQLNGWVGGYVESRQIEVITKHESFVVKRVVSTGLQIRKVLGV